MQYAAGVLASRLMPTSAVRDLSWCGAGASHEVDWRFLLKHGLQRLHQTRPPRCSCEPEAGVKKK